MSVTATDYEQTVKENMPLVNMLARRFLGRGVEYDDLFQAGCLGLFKAAKRYDASMNTAFSTYAVPVIIGEMRLLFRDGCAIKVGRKAKSVGNAALAARAKLCTVLGREPHISEIANELGVNSEDIADAVCACSAPVSIDDNEHLQNTLMTDAGEAIITRLDIRNALRTLAKDEQLLIVLRYEKEFSQQKTGEIMKISQVQVSRREKQILQKLREQLM